ncbi:MAG: DUF3617 domain-containing protein [Alphaproteobacteria bacterium]|nr:DUF3617 domain-containing protein [Alphaproteobacteria bacterium]
MTLMRSALPVAATACTLLATMSITLAEGLPITPGLWEMTTQNPMTGTDVVRQECMTEAVFDPSHMIGKERGCDVSNQAVSGNTVDYDMTCQDPSGQGAMQAHFSFTIDGDQGNGNVDMSFDMGGQTMKMNHKVSAKRVGDC